ncbi:hypothetical protein RJ641_017033 [Dillenia turbinata]|uniref:Uncharacterized protein n=1 Tax=Dillenia turbinata TaxID=194707 RepID=A0AAN8UVW2_9MAGN
MIPISYYGLYCLYKFLFFTPKLHITQSIVNNPHPFFQLKISNLQKPRISNSQNLIFQMVMVDNAEIREDQRVQFRWVEMGYEISEAQKETISQLPAKMITRCKAVLKQIICFSSEKTCLSDLTDELIGLLFLKRIDHPLPLQMNQIIHYAAFVRLQNLLYLKNLLRPILETIPK